MKIVIPTYDKYSSVVPYNIAAIRKTWPDCPYDIVVVATNTPPSVQDAEVICLGEDLRFGSNMRRFLRDYYDEPTLLIWLDDYFLTYLDQDVVDRANQLVLSKLAFCVRLSRRFTPANGKAFPGDPDFVYIRKKSRYSLSLQAAIWSSRTLYGVLANGETAWQTETRGSTRIAQRRRGLPALLGVDKRATEYKNYFRKGVIDLGAHRWAEANIAGYIPLGKVRIPPVRLVPKEVRVPVNRVLALAHKHGINTFVETGTYHGDTAEWASNVFDMVYTIEAYKPHFLGSQRRLTGLTNVKTLLGDSRVVLERVLSSIEDTAILWLDAHWLGNAGYAHHEKDECPLREELQTVVKCKVQHLVIIDDAKFFVNRPRQPHIESQWPTLQEIEDILVDYVVRVHGDVIVAIPRNLQLDEDSHTDL